MGGGKEIWHIFGMGGRLRNRTVPSPLPKKS